MKSKGTAAQALSACSAAPSSPHPRKMEKLEAVEKRGWMDFFFYLAGAGSGQDPTQAGKDGFMQAWLIGRALVL